MDWKFSAVQLADPFWLLLKPAFKHMPGAFPSRYFSNPTFGYTSIGDASTYADSISLRGAPDFAERNHPERSTDR